VKPRKSTFDSKYIKMHTLGSGNFGKVYLVEERASKEQVSYEIHFITGDDLFVVVCCQNSG
jgi:hypothetical protein